jgi:Tol biopolymer transport system component
VSRRHISAVLAVLGLVAGVTLAGGAGPAGATFPGMNGKIAFSSDRDGNLEIYTMNADGSGQRRLTASPGTDDRPTWSPDGKEIAFSRTGDDSYEIYVMAADGSNQTEITTTPGENFWPAWSPDGSKIAFMNSLDGLFYDIYVMNADGSAPTRLASGGTPDWSPDGSKIAFFRDSGTPFPSADIYVMDADGTHQTRLTTDAGVNYEPSWSPDGSRIAFASTRVGGDFDIYVMNADGSNQSRLTTDTANDEYPSWSPDGRKLAFSSSRDGKAAMYVMNADGSGQTRVTFNDADDEDGDWQALADSDGDGIPDAQDPDGVAAAISTLPADAFAGGGGHRTAFLSRLDGIERSIAAGDLSGAIAALQDLRRKVDGCGSVADHDDWIADCTAQRDIRALIDGLIASLSA